MEHGENIPAQKETEIQGSRLPQENVHCERPQGPRAQKSERQSQPEPLKDCPQALLWAFILCPPFVCKAGGRF